MWFRRPDSSKVLQQMADMMTIVEKRVASLEIDVDSLKMRMRKRMFPKEEEANPTSSEGIDDGFNELRKLNKLHST